MLDQVIEHDFGKNIIFVSGLSIWELRQDHVIQQNLDTAPGHHRFELYFETHDMDNVVNKLAAEQVQLLHEIHEEPWGQRTVRFFDPDGHLIEIGEPLEVFVRNMHNSGLSEQQIADKSGIPVHTVKNILS
jgi:hypothetical protein